MIDKVRRTEEKHFGGSMLFWLLSEPVDQCLQSYMLMQWICNHGLSVLVHNAYKSVETEAGWKACDDTWYVALVT